MAQRTRPVVVFPPGLRQQIHAIASVNVPREICGILQIERNSEGARILRARCLPNRARNGIAGYRMRATEVRQVARQWEQIKPVEIGYFHSHSLGSFDPSSHDVRTARTTGGIHIIVSRHGSLAFEYAGNRFRRFDITD